MGNSSIERRLWSLFEPVHAVVYFAPQSGAPFEAAGLRGFWRRYFAGRTAPLGAIGPGPVTAAFFGFAPRMVARALPDIWTRITPKAALDARAEAARVSLRALLAADDPVAAGAAGPLGPGDRASAGVAGSLGPGGPASAAATDPLPLDDPALVEAADLLSVAARSIEVSGRVMAGANADLPRPDEPLDRLWQAATILREHRGDGHVAALLTAGVDGCESLVWRAALEGGDSRAGMQAARGWTDDEWAAAADRLRDRGWLTAAGEITEPGRTAYGEVEALTDRLAAGPWQRLGTTATERCARLLQPIAERVWTVLPDDNPIPLRRTVTAGAPGSDPGR